MKWLGHLDNQLQISTVHPGLRYFQFKHGDDAWADHRWRTWPVLNGCLDQGSDGVAAANAMQYHLGVTCQIYFDWCHSACRDLVAGYKSIGKFSLLLLFLVILNLPRGRDRDEGVRFQQMVERLAYMFSNFQHDNFSLIEARSADMVAELQDKLEVTSESSTGEALWNHLRSEAPHEKKQYRAKLC